MGVVTVDLIGLIAIATAALAAITGMGLGFSTQSSLIAGVSMGLAIVVVLSLLTGSNPG